MSAAGALALFFAAAAGCGFGIYDGGSSPQVTNSTTGVPDAGQWWPWVCPDGIYPIPASTPLPYSAQGSCGPGGALLLSVDGCEMIADWSVLGLADVETTQPTSAPNLGGWILTAGGDGADGGVALDGGTCTATPDVAAGVLDFTCTAGTPPTTVCLSTLTPVGGP